MAAITTHRNLLAWQEAMNLVEIVYRDTSSFPNTEAFGLTGQLRRAAISVPSNIAEGAGRNSSGEFLQFLGVASGSLAELETQLQLAIRLGYLGVGAASIAQLDKVGRLLNGLRRSLRHRILRS